MENNKKEFKNGSNFQRFKIVKMLREDINLAEYNPRRINAKELSKLKKSLKRDGLVKPLLFNERTNTLIEGHQRIKLLDELNGGNLDYTLDIAVVDVSKKEEMELNVRLNNQTLMGEYDEDLLNKMLQDDTLELEIEAMGFDDDEIALFAEDYFKKQEEQEDEEVKSDIEQIKALKERRKDAVNKANENNTEDFSRTIIFKDGAGASKFSEYFGFDFDDLYLNGELINDILGIKSDKDLDEKEEK